MARRAAPADRKSRAARKGRAAPADGAGAERAPAAPAGKLPPLGLRARAIAAARAFGTRRRLRTWRWLLAELVIVFLGVYGAVVAQGWRELRADEAMARQMTASLERAIRNIEEHERHQGAQIEAMIRSFDARLAAGERPSPPAYREPGAERPPHSNFWQSITASGGARLIEPDLLYSIHDFLNSMDSIGERYVRYAAFTEARVLPWAARDPGHFYGADGRLLPEYAAYVDRLRELRALERETMVDAREIRRRLAAWQPD